MTHIKLYTNYTHAIHTESPLPRMFNFRGMSPQKIKLEKNDFHSLKADHHLLHRDAHVVIYIKLIDYCFTNMYGWQVRVNMDTQFFWLDFCKKT